MRIHPGQRVSFEVVLRHDTYCICGTCAERAGLKLLPGEISFGEGLCSWCYRPDYAPLFKLEAYGQDLYRAFCEYVFWDIYGKPLGFIGRRGWYKFWSKKPAPFPRLIPSEPKWWPK